MDTYIINGVHVEYDTFDLTNMEIYRDELKRLSELSKLADGVNLDNYIERIREMCEGVMDAFDTVIGEGTSELLFGSKMNAETIPAAWKEFAEAVEQRMKGSPLSSPPHINREQRRAEEREKRREAARKRVEERKKHET